MTIISQIDISEKETLDNISNYSHVCICIYQDDEFLGKTVCNSNDVGSSPFPTITIVAYYLT